MFAHYRKPVLIILERNGRGRAGRNDNMILEFLADGFEEIEALTPVDVLRRGGLDVKTVAVGGMSKKVCGSHGIEITADLSMEEALSICAEPEMIILPGGMPGTRNLDADENVEKYIFSSAERGAFIAAICAAPMVLGKRGLLRGRRAICFPGFENTLDGAVISDKRVETDGNMITACGMGAATEFALELLAVMKGESAAENMHSVILAK